jgi:pimeloyl-ACP methyl ester carboxylesterase
LRNFEILTVPFVPEAKWGTDWFDALRGKWGTGWFDALVGMLRPSMPRLHRGFARRSNDHFAAMLLALAKLFDNDLSQIKRLTFSGHSLGGAVAQATAFRLKGWLKRALSHKVLSPTPILTGY